MINRIRNYDYVNRELRSPPEPKGEQVQPPPIIKHKDNVSQLTIYNTGWTEGYYAGYEDGQAFSTVNRVTVGVFLLATLTTGIAIGLWL